MPTARGLGVSRRPEARRGPPDRDLARDRGVRVYAEAGMARWPFTPLRQFGWETYAWLIYSLPYLFSSFDPRLTALETAAMLAGYVVFLGLYLAGQLVRGWRILWIVGGLDLLAIVFTRRNPGAATFFIYGIGAARRRRFRRDARRSRWRSRCWRQRRPWRRSACRGGTTAMPARHLDADRRRHDPGGRQGRRRREAAPGAGRSRAPGEARRARAHRARPARRARPHAVGSGAQERAGAEADRARSLARGDGDG